MGIRSCLLLFMITLIILLGDVHICSCKEANHVDNEERIRVKFYSTFFRWLMQRSSSSLLCKQSRILADGNW
ncbi:hypothetical protein HAX54_037164 [Datura stramonium]|uniref:Secreted protein n=1 Tax=Datura stramonium TaxID=4076 RepID=A0ABS8VL74_DATST|nr:hypothetical protein [Datura stramonium]